MEVRLNNYFCLNKSFLLPVILIVSSILLFNCNNDNLKEEIKIKKSINDVKSNTQKQVESKTESSVGLRESISSSETSKHIGDSVSVKGNVADVYISEKVAYLNFDKKFPENTFTCTVFKKYFPEFGDLKVYKNKNVEVTGKISSYKNKPQMILYAKDQIKILNE